jgi:outer membrane protein TolC
MLSATCLAIFLIPVLFVVVEKKLGRGRAEGPGGEAMRRLTAVLALAGAVSGCSVGPDYKRPVLPAPEAFYGAPGPASEASLADAKWWDVFSDPALRSLIDEALRNGYDVRLAAARVEEARARYGIAHSQYFPEAGYSAGVTRAHNGSYQTPGNVTGNSINVSGLLSWEIDVWGRVRRLNEQARAQYLASEEGRRGVELSLVGDVASAYFDLRALDAELEIARRTRDTFQDTYDLFSRRLGAAPPRRSRPRAPRSSSRTRRP